jgi:hypothetical protein
VNVYLKLTGVLIPSLIPAAVYQEQGDQIGRIFAHGAIAYFGQFLENYNSSPASPTQA